MIDSRGKWFVFANVPVAKRPRMNFFIEFGQVLFIMGVGQHQLKSKWVPGEESHKANNASDPLSLGFDLSTPAFRKSWVPSDRAEGISKGPSL